MRSQMGRFYIIILNIFILFSFTSCKKNQPAPSFVYIPAIEVNSNYGISGSSSSQITNVKVFNGTKLIGVYELPINVPFLSEGPANIQCLALVQDYGIVSNISEYIFYNSSSDEVNLAPEKQDTIYPIMDYNPTSTTNYWFEDFEGAGHSFVSGSGSTGDLDIIDDPEDVFEGIGSGSFDLSLDTAYLKYFTEESFSYSSSKPAYVELDYKNNQSFIFSLILNPSSGPSVKMPVFQFNNSDVIDGELSWNKIYLEIGSFLNDVQNLNSFDICFEIERNQNVSDPIIMIDNVKVISRK